MRNAVFIALAVLLAAAVSVVAAYVRNFGPTPSEKQETWGQFGDYVGGILNPIFGALTLIGVVITVWLQRDLIKQQSEDAIAEANRQSELLAETKGANDLQRLFSQHQAFASTVFHLMAAIDAKATNARIEMSSQAVQRLNKFEKVMTYPIKGGESFGVRGDVAFTGPSAFHAMLAELSLEVEYPANAGNTHGEDSDSFRSRRAGECLQNFDYAIGPSMRQLCDVLQCCRGYEAAFEHDAAVPRPSLNPPAFYARMAMNSLPIEELQVFAIYVGSGLATESIKIAAEKYAVFDSLDKTWWGRKYMPVS